MTMDLSASIYMKPATFEELFKRKIESLKNTSEYMFFKIVKIAEEKNWIYMKDETYYCYKKTVKNVLNPSGYDL